MRYTVVLIPEEGDTGRYVAYVPALPGCVTFGSTIADALVMAEDAARSTIEGLIEDGDDIPIEPLGAIVAAIKVTVPEPAVA
jgi:predicted RNase H-like HicB family nuclease